MDDGKVAVFQKMQIQLDAVAPFQSRPESRHGVFRQAAAVETPVGIVPAAKLLHAGIVCPAPKSQQVQHKQNQENPDHVQSSTSKASSPFFTGAALSPWRTKPMVKQEARAKMAA